MDNGGNLGGSSSFLSRFAGKVQLRQDDGSISPLDSDGFAFGPSSQASAASDLSAESANPKPTNRRLRASSGATRNPAPSDGLCNISENTYEMGQTQAGATVFASAMAGATSPSKAEPTSAADLRRRLGGGAPRPLATEAPPAANFLAAPPSAFATSTADANSYANDNVSASSGGVYGGLVGYQMPAAVPPPLSPTYEEVSLASARSRNWDAAPSTRLNPPTHDAPVYVPAPAPSTAAAPPPTSDVFAAYASYQQPAKNEAGVGAAPKGGRRAARPGVADLQRLLAQPDAPPASVAATRAEQPPSPRSIPRGNLYGNSGSSSINSNNSGSSSAGRGQYGAGSGGASTAAAANSKAGGSYANIHQRQRSPRAAPSQPLQPTPAAPSQGRYFKFADYEPYQDLAAPLLQDLAPQSAAQHLAQDGYSCASGGGNYGYSRVQNCDGYSNGQAGGGGASGEAWEDADEEYEELYGGPVQLLSQEAAPQQSMESGRGGGRGGASAASGASSIASGYSNSTAAEGRRQHEESSGAPGRTRPREQQQREQQQQQEQEQRSTASTTKASTGAGRGAGGKGAASGVRRRPGAGRNSNGKNGVGTGVEDSGSGGGRVLSSGAVATLSMGPSAGQPAHRQPASAANTKLVGDARNAQLVRNSTDQLHFSRQARPVNYEPCTVNQWRSEKGDSEGKLVEIKGSVHRPDPNREDLVAKRQNADRVKEFAKNLNRLNMAELKDKPTAPPVSLGQPKPPPDNARERAKQFAEKLPKPKPVAWSTRQRQQEPSRQQQQQPQGRPINQGESAEAAAEARAAAKAAAQRADALAALEQRHEFQRAEADRMRRNFGL